MMANGNWTDCGDQFIVYTEIELLVCTPETNIMFYTSFTSIKKKEINKRNFQILRGRKGNYIKGKEGMCGKQNEVRTHGRWRWKRK